MNLWSSIDEHSLLTYLLHSLATTNFKHLKRAVDCLSSLNAQILTLSLSKIMRTLWQLGGKIGTSVMLAWEIVAHEITQSQCAWQCMAVPGSAWLVSSTLNRRIKRKALTYFTQIQFPLYMREMKGSHALPKIQFPVNNMENVVCSITHYSGQSFLIYHRIERLYHALTRHSFLYISWKRKALKNFPLSFIYHEKERLSQTSPGHCFLYISGKWKDLTHFPQIQFPLNNMEKVVRSNALFRTEFPYTS